MIPPSHRNAVLMRRPKKEPGSVRDRAEAVVRVKPHISIEAAIISVEEIDRLLADSLRRLPGVSTWPAVPARITLPDGRPLPDGSGRLAQHV